jgi:hypothetical protein
MQICISILKGSKVMESKAPNLEGLLQTPCEVLYLHLAPLMARRMEAVRGTRMKTKHFLVMRKDTVAHECVDLRVCGLIPRGASRPWLNRPTLKIEKCK